MKAAALNCVLLAAQLAYAVQPPNIQGMKAIFQESFKGCGGCLPDADIWNTALHVDTNNELQEYTTSNKNIQLSGGETLQLVPWKEDEGKWSSGRIETNNSWTPQPGTKMRYQAALRMGEAVNRKGMWPAFWMMGDAVRQGTDWPMCGELDIYEQVNGDMQGHGTVHCGGKEDGGPCNEPMGLTSSVVVPDNAFHAWALEIDRTSGLWEQETISWSMDGNIFRTLSGAEIGDQATWSTLAHSPFYIIMNIAVGGQWPGDPSDATEDGYSNMLEVEYVAVYETT